MKYNCCPSEQKIVNVVSSAWKDCAPASIVRNSCSCSITPSGEIQANVDNVVHLAGLIHGDYSRAIKDACDYLGVETVIV